MSTELKDKLEQAKARLDQNEKDRDTLANAGEEVKVKIAALEKQIAASEVTYSIGDKFESCGEQRMLVGGEGNMFIIDLGDGEVMFGPKPYEEGERITESEFAVLRQTMTYNRVWDARKQKKC